MNSTTSSYAKHGHFGEFPAVQHSFLSLKKKDTIVRRFFPIFEHGEIFLGIGCLVLSYSRSVVSVCVRQIKVFFGMFGGIWKLHFPYFQTCRNFARSRSVPC